MMTYLFGRLRLSIFMTTLIFAMAAGTALAAERNEGISCVTKGSTVKAEWDDRSGTRTQYIRVGSTARAGYECMGRCGPGCGSWVPSSWTKDCMDHDQCSNVNKSSGGSGDANCGDEFDHAADDWTFGVLRGCRG